ncbi:MAG: response regulator transcription factor [Chloroflexota bacterium]
MANEKILVVDDEEAVTELIKEWLEEGDYRAITASDGRSGLKQFFEHKPDLALVDIIMPGMDGFELCQRIREVSEIPIIILSAKGAEVDKVRGLKLGSDEYLVKPVGGKELLARVEATLRRMSMTSAEAPDTYSDGILTIDYKKRTVYVRDKHVSLTPIEYRLLVHLVENQDQVLANDQLWARVWGWEYGSQESVKWHMSYLRRKIEENPKEPKLIVTVRGFGYRYQRPQSSI